MFFLTHFLYFAVMFRRPYFWIIAGFLSLCFLGQGLSTLSAQTLTPREIKPGREKITIQLPKDYRWDTRKVPKDESSIRAWTHHGTLRAAASTSAATASALPELTLEVTTIDRRYYPIRAGSSVTDKLTMMQNADPMSRLDIHQNKIQEKLKAIIYTISPGEPGDKQSSAEDESYVLLGLAAEGPTAFHEVLLKIPRPLASPELIAYWTNVLASSLIE